MKILVSFHIRGFIAPAQERLPQAKKREIWEGSVYQHVVRKLGVAVLHTSLAFVRSDKAERKAALMVSELTSADRTQANALLKTMREALSYHRKHGKKVARFPSSFQLVFLCIQRQRDATPDSSQRTKPTQSSVIASPNKSVLLASFCRNLYSLVCVATSFNASCDPCRC